MCNAKQQVVLCRASASVEPSGTDFLMLITAESQPSHNNQKLCQSTVNGGQITFKRYVICAVCTNECSAYRSVDLTPIAARTFRDSSLIAMLSVCARIRMIYRTTTANGLHHRWLRWQGTRPIQYISTPTATESIFSLLPPRLPQLFKHEMNSETMPFPLPHNYRGIVLHGQCG